MTNEKAQWMHKWTVNELFLPDSMLNPSNIQNKPRVNNQNPHPSVHSGCIKSNMVDDCSLDINYIMLDSNHVTSLYRNHAPSHARIVVSNMGVDSTMFAIGVIGHPSANANTDGIAYRMDNQPLQHWMIHNVIYNINPNDPTLLSYCYKASPKSELEQLFSELELGTDKLQVWFSHSCGVYTMYTFDISMFSTCLTTRPALNI